MLREWKRSESGQVAVSLEHLMETIKAASGETGISTAVVNLLEPLDFEVHVAKSTSRASDLRYVLSVHHSKAKTMWRFTRSFDEYETFQKHMLEALHHGHFCSGGCPWLESFIGAAFDTTRRKISGSLSTVIERRRKTLVEVMQGIRRFLINRANHVCKYALHNVDRVFLEFIYGGVIDSSHVLDDFLAAAAVAPAPKIFEDPEKCGMTKKAQRRLRAQSTSALSKASPAMATTHSPVGKASSTGELQRHSFIAAAVSDGKPEQCTICEDFMPTKDIYVLRLACGHRFHDECAMPKLNQRLQCPTCNMDLAQFA